jgi:hypothetical protein
MSIVKLNNKAVSNATAFGSISSLGSMTFIKKLTASGSATLSFVDGASGVVLDDTYKEYVFTFKNIHPATANQNFTFNMSIDGGSNYNVVKTTTVFRADLSENGAGGRITYMTTLDLAQSTAFQYLSGYNSNDNDGNLGGQISLYNPSSTTFVKHFMSNMNTMTGDPGSYNNFVAGYGNTTSAVNAVQFKYASGNIDAGDICLYGIA